MAALTREDLERGDAVEVGRLGMGGWLEWMGPFAVVVAEGCAVLVRDERGEGYEPAERRVSYAQIRRRVFGPELPAWLVRERSGGSFEAGARVVTPRGPGAVVYRRMDPRSGYSQVEAYSVKLDGVAHTGVIYGPEQVEAAGCYACDRVAVGTRDLRHEPGGQVESACERHAEAR